jgi:SulP family sulfate permease
MSIFNQIDFKNIRGDAFGGVTAAIVSLPMALAFGVSSGAGPVAGLYGAVCVGFFAALFGGTPALMQWPLLWSCWRDSFKLSLEYSG